MKKKTISVSAILVIVFLTLYVLCLYIPFLWAFLSSFKNGSYEIRNNVWGLPQQFKFENYVNVFQNLTVDYDSGTEILQFNFGEMMVNSVLYAFVAALVTNITTYMMGYARGRFDFKFLGIIDILVIISISLPIFGTLPSSIQMFTNLGLIKNFFGVAVIAKISFLSLYYFVTVATVKGVPKALIEAAEIDGASEFRILTRIIFPITASTFLTIFIFNFISAWNDWQTPYIFLNNMPTVSYGLWVFNSNPTQAGDLALKICACFIVAIPVLILFLIFHKRLMNGVSVSDGIKE